MSGQWPGNYFLGEQLSKIGLIITGRGNGPVDYAPCSFSGREKKTEAPRGRTGRGRK
jgi:hypothetical protein